MTVLPLFFWRRREHAFAVALGWLKGAQPGTLHDPILLDVLGPVLAMAGAPPESPPDR
jgi:hypothetical protein